MAGGRGDDQRREARRRHSLPGGACQALGATPWPRRRGHGLLAAAWAAGNGGGGRHTAAGTLHTGVSAGGWLLRSMHWEPLEGATESGFRQGGWECDSDELVGAVGPGIAATIPAEPLACADMLQEALALQITEEQADWQSRPSTQVGSHSARRIWRVQAFLCALQALSITSTRLHGWVERSETCCSRQCRAQRLPAAAGRSAGVRRPAELQGNDQMQPRRLQEPGKSTLAAAAAAPPASVGA